MRSTINKLSVIFLVFSLCSFVFVEENRITVYLIGDSTVSDYSDSQAPLTGWGTPFAVFFDKTVTVKNHARGGRSTRTFIAEKRWQTVSDSLKEGDYLFIQFGHNDEATEAKYVDRYTSPEDYRKNLVRFITEARAKKAFPVLVTPVSRRRFGQDGKTMETHVQYSGIMTAVSTEYKVPLIDLDTRSRQLYDSFGKEQSALLFNVSKPGDNPQFPEGMNDNTHFNEYGARLLAQLVLDEMKKLNLDLVRHIVRPGIK